MTSPTREATPVRSPLLSINEACEYLRLGTSTIYEKMGIELQSVKLGRRRYVTKASADAYILRGTEAVQPRSASRRR